MGKRGSFEDQRNIDNHLLLEMIIREGLNDITNIGTGHHIMYWQGNDPLPNEFPSADCVIFDHEIAKRVWGEDWKTVLTKLALEPVETRDALLSQLYFGR